MPIDFSVELGGGSEDIYVRTSGTATLESLRAFTRALLAHPSFRPGLRILVDHRDVDFSQLSASDARARVEDALELSDEIGDARIATVVGSMADYGMQRMMGLIAGARYGFETRPFTELEDARAWLAQ